MFKSKSKKAGFFSTILFHLALFLICFFCSIGYTSIEIPKGIEIEFVPYHHSNPVEELVNVNEHSDIEKSNFGNKKIVEEIITEKSETVHIPNDQDTLTLAETEKNNISPSISSELEKALSTLSEQQSSIDFEESSNDIKDSETNIVNDNTVPDDVQDAHQLENRFAVSKITPNYSCKESGTVVVRVWVNREGKTIKAESGIIGTTDSSPCLWTEAQVAALQTTWTPYFNAPEIQIGQITYNFYQN